MPQYPMILATLIWERVDPVSLGLVVLLFFLVLFSMTLRKAFASSISDPDLFPATVLIGQGPRVELIFLSENVVHAMLS